MRVFLGMILGAVLLAAQLGFADHHKSGAGASLRVDDETITLMGKVTRPALKSDAENVVKRVEGVEARS